jgi:hypothetical protein
MDPKESLREYPETFRMSIGNGNRLCLGSYLGADYDGCRLILRRGVLSLWREHPSQDRGYRVRPNRCM